MTIEQRMAYVAECQRQINEQRAEIERDKARQRAFEISMAIACQSAAFIATAPLRMLAAEIRRAA